MTFILKYNGVKYSQGLVPQVYFNMFNTYVWKYELKLTKHDGTCEFAAQVRPMSECILRNKNAVSGTFTILI